MLTKTFPSGLARFVLTVILLLSLLGTQHIRPAAAQTLTVTNINDSGAGSLRQAVASAVAGDTITFAPALAGQTIVLATTIIINKNLTIDGSALSTPITISGVTTHDGTGNSQVFLIYFDVVATLKGLIITKSSVTGTTRSGGINIYNNATLTIIDCTITNNSDSGILNWYGTLIMQDSIVSNNSAISGGGIYGRGGSITLDNVLITNNTAVAAGAPGGGILSAGILTITNSTISNNIGGGIKNEQSLILANSVVQGNEGAGIFNDLYSTAQITDTLIRQNQGGGMGAGLYNQGTATVTGSTFHGNSATFGAGIVNTHTLTVTNSTFFGNHTEDLYGGAISDSGTLTVVNSTFSGNTASSGAGIYSTSIPIIRNSIFWGNTGGEIAITPHWEQADVTHSIVQGGYPGAGNLDADPLLGALADNGGSTQTMALGPGSPAIHAGENASCAATDQRGVTRPRGNSCDIGSYEKIFYYVKGNATGANNGSSWANAYRSLQSALAAAAISDEIWVAAGTYKPTTGTDRTISFALKNGVAVFGGFAGTETTLSQRNVKTNLTILSGNIGASGVNSDNSYHVVSSDGTNDVTILDGFTITAGNANGSSPYNNGGGLYNQNSQLRLENMIFDGNVTSGNGGGLYNTGSDSTLWNVTFHANAADFSGGGLYNNFSQPTLENITLSQNFAGRSGGGMANRSSHPSLTNVTFYNNSAVTYGGGLAQSFSNPTLVHVTFNKNSTTDGGGGAIINDASNPIIINSILYGNVGGEIRNLTGSVPQVSYSLIQNGYPGSGNINADPRLGELQDNGGLTQTLALGAGSPAIDGGRDADCPMFDQRGMARPQGSHCDMGAYELELPIHVSILGGEVGSYSLASGESKRVSFARENIGLVKITNDDNLPLIAAERVLYKVQGVNTSYSELMGLPDTQVDTTYWLPWYNNVDLDTQLRIANVGTNDATVHVFVGTNEVTPPEGLSIVAIGSIRQSFPNINGGPVRIVSDNGVPIVVSERVLYKVQGLNTSYSEMMALPDNQLDTIYWLPWYNNVDLDTQLRIANVSNSTAKVHVFIGPNEVTPPQGISLAVGASQRLSYAGVNSGPVKIVSDQQIVAAERVIYKVAGKQTSFTEMMALPNNQVDTTYWLPWYNNKDLDTQIRFANVGTAETTVHIFIGGVEQGSGFTLQPGESTRQSFANINAGPVQIVSGNGVPIVAAERVIYKVGGKATSFTEMMALPDGQLDTTLWFPWYNNADLDTQLRFGVP